MNYSHLQKNFLHNYIDALLCKLIDGAIILNHSHGLQVLKVTLHLMLKLHRANDWVQNSGQRVL